MPSGASPERARQRYRPYRSPKRQEQARQTRRQILAAATEQFRKLGYAGTTMGAIAAAAGVSVPTVELAFGTKAALLKAAIDVAIAGDDEPVPVLDRPWARRAQAATTPQEFLVAATEVLVAAAQRSDALVLVAFEAARGDERLAPLAARLKAQRAVTAAWIVDGLAARAPLRDTVDRAEAIDVVWMLMDPALFDRLTTDRGWTPQRYGAWFADSALRLLVAAPPQDQ
jgi:AcrR family transcriptional regulator